MKNKLLCLFSNLCLLSPSLSNRLRGKEAEVVTFLTVTVNCQTLSLTLTLEASNVKWNVISVEHSAVEHVASQISRSIMTIN